MKKSTFAILLAIIAAPVILGILLNTGDGSKTRVLSKSPANAIGLVRINDVIFSADDWLWQLKELRRDNTIAGVVLRIDSPGGAVAPSQELFSEVLRYREQNKPLVVSMGNIAASGGYYIAAPAMKIFASPGTLTGSIGVIFSFPQYYELLDKIGVRMETLKAGAYKDMATPNRAMTEGERSLLQSLINDTHDQFITDVSSARSMAADSLRKFADGRIFTGRQACHAGLIDTLGGYEEAISFLRIHCNLGEKTRVIEKKKNTWAWRELLAESFFGHIPMLNSVARPAGCYYLWEGR